MARNFGRPCCEPAVAGSHITRRAFLRGTGKSLLALGVVTAVGCSPGEQATSPRIPGTWESRGDAPFSRHAHSGAPTDGRLLVMGDRRGVLIGEHDTPEGVAQKTIHIFGTEFDFTSDIPVEVSSGELVRVIFTNDGRVDHDITFANAGVYLRAAPGETVETLATFEDPEIYFCSIGGHAEAGMVGGLVVDGEEPDEQEVGPGEGETQMWWFTPSERTWEEAPSLPHAYDHVTMVSVGGDVYSIGGYTGNIGTSRPDVYVLTAGAAEWERRADLPVPRGGMAGASDGERIFVAGGRSESEGTPSSRNLFVYDPATDTWDSSGPDMPTGRDHISGVFLGGTFWVIAGRGDGRRVSSTPVTEGYDIGSSTWLVGAPPPIPTSAHGLDVIDDRIVLFGGEGPTSTVAGAVGREFEVYPKTFLYDPRADSWSRTSNALIGVHHPAFGVVDGVLYTVGGGIVSGVSSTTAVQSFRIDI